MTQHLTVESVSPARRPKKIVVHKCCFCGHISEPSFIANRIDRECPKCDEGRHTKGMLPYTIGMARYRLSDGFQGISVYAQHLIEGDEFLTPAVKAWAADKRLILTDDAMREQMFDAYLEGTTFAYDEPQVVSDITVMPHEFVCSCGRDFKSRQGRYNHAKNHGHSY